MSLDSFSASRCENLPEIYGGKLSRYVLLQKLLDEYNPEMIVDVGCVLGDFTESQREKTIGIDICKSNIDKIHAAGRMGICSDLNGSMPLPGNHADCVWCGETIEHIFHTEIMLKEICRILMPNGILILSTPNLASWINCLMLPFGLQPLFSEVSAVHTVGNPFRKNVKIPGGHIRLFTWRALKGLLEICGFENVKFYNANLLTNKYVQFLDMIIGSIFPKSCSGLFITCNKKGG